MTRNQRSQRKIGQDEANDVWRHQIMFDIESEVSCNDINFRKKNLGDPREYLTKSIENRLHLKRRLYRFQLKKGISIDEYINNYTVSYRPS